MGKHAKDIMPMLDTEKLLTGKVLPTKQTVEENVKIIDDSIAKYPFPPAPVTE
jgi:hypothetical protein